MFHINAISSSTCDDKESKLSFCTFSSSSFKIYSMFLAGQVDESAYAEGNTTAKVLTTIFGFILIPLVFSVLVAIVTDSYGEVRHKGEKTFWWNRMNFVVSCIQLQSFFQIKGLPSWSYDDKSRILWERILLEFESPKDFNVRLARKEMQHRWPGKTSWAFSDADDEEPSWTKRILLSVFVFLWFSVGFLMVGLPWPPQAREYFFCPEIPDKPAGGDDNAGRCQDLKEREEMKSNIKSLS